MATIEDERELYLFILQKAFNVTYEEATYILHVCRELYSLMSPQEIGDFTVLVNKLILLYRSGMSVDTVNEFIMETVDTYRKQGTEDTEPKLSWFSRLLKWF